jgi:hypothetical protein
VLLARCRPELAAYGSVEHEESLLFNSYVPKWLSLSFHNHRDVEILGKASREARLAVSRFDWC